jgi:hypothetical protein
LKEQQNKRTKTNVNKQKEKKDRRLKEQQNKRTKTNVNKQKEKKDRRLKEQQNKRTKTNVIWKTLTSFRWLDTTNFKGEILQSSKSSYISKLSILSGYI